MSSVSDLIFKNASHKVTSGYGMRTLGGQKKMHYGTDYGTNSKKIGQYAIADGEIISCGKDSAEYKYALYVWVKYPSLGVKMMHYHLDSYKVSKGQSVKKGDLLGYTGSTGNSTGIHLHLGIKNIDGTSWIDPEKWSKEVYDVKYKNSGSTTTSTIDRSATSTAKPQYIWEFLIQKIKNPYGVAGLMGNLYYESALIANNLQNSYSSSLNLTDAQYTSKVDSGAYTNFVKDKAGYGLAQWTYWTRKQGLYNYWKQKGGSIGSVHTQLEFLYKELSEGFTGVLKVLKEAKTVKEASNKVLFDFESPKDQGSSVQTKRTSKGEEYYKAYKDITAEVAAKNQNSSSETEAEEEEEGFNFSILWAVIGENEQ